MGSSCPQVDTLGGTLGHLSGTRLLSPDTAIGHCGAILSSWFSQKQQRTLASITMPSSKGPPHRDDLQFIFFNRLTPMVLLKSHFATLSLQANAIAS